MSRYSPIARVNSNPFAGPKQAISETIYCIDEYTLNTVISMSPMAIRLLLIIAAKYEADKGLSVCTHEYLKKLTNNGGTKVSKGIAELCTAGFIAKGKNMYTYYVNQKVFKPVTIIQQ